MQIQDLGLTPYTDAWKIQEAAHEDVLAGGPERIFLLEHPPVITYGRRPGIDKHLLASKDQLEKLGVEIVQSDRGGDITFHGPGQLVVYPIIRLADHRLSVSGYVHLLEKIIIATLARFQLPASTDPTAVGVWTPNTGPSYPHCPPCGPSKVCAIGVRIRRGVTLHGLALNVTTDLRFFDLIIPCGLQNRPVTSLQHQLGEGAPKMEEVKSTLVEEFRQTFLRPCQAPNDP
jgi:lipoate-protein ligase B